MPLVRAVGLVVAAWVVDCGGASVAPEQGARVVIVWSATVADVGTCGDRVLLRGGSIEVTPGGEDDTAAIQCALDHAQTRTVLLGPGTFRVAQIVAVGFRGTLTGAGPEATTITNVDRPYDVTPIDWNLAPPSETHPWPTMFAFVGGSFTVSDLSIHVVGDAPTTGWSAFGISVKALAHAISVTGDAAEATFDRVHFRGEDAPADLVFGRNVINAIDAEGITGANPAALVLSLAVRDCRFDHLASGVPDLGTNNRIVP